jgi:hypothetical protein
VSKQPVHSERRLHAHRQHRHLGPCRKQPPAGALLLSAGVASNGVFAGLMLALAAGAYSNGVIQPTPLFPDWSELGSTPITAAVAIAIVVPVLLNCDVCHQSLHPLMPLLQVRQLWLQLWLHPQPHCCHHGMRPGLTCLTVLCCALLQPWHAPWLACIVSQSCAVAPSVYIRAATSLLVGGCLSSCFGTARHVQRAAAQAMTACATTDEAVLDAVLLSCAGVPACSPTRFPACSGW